MTQQTERTLQCTQQMSRMIPGVPRRQQTVAQQPSEQGYDVDSDVELNVDKECDQSSNEFVGVLEPLVDWVPQGNTTCRTTSF